ncbi:DoxX family protein [Nonomuraea africana]|uniref:Membrane protein YphA (DoxX/SURF4 family) n=1 Tax=Nonomuraea africana TaxID=46171 RepID=A0ABR9K794_9ACTN|nr:DoxX family protein [Nonomuraea africana]MBE1557427.1 putative membrane protein YphA (DoxX/SURF4 family) [Nonomuraea africana]
MNVFLWVLQILLAVMFAMSGLEKASQPWDKLTRKYPWMGHYPQAVVRLIAVPELLGALGLIVPAATGIAPILTPIAATGLAILTALAATMHIRRKETSGLTVTAVLFVLAAFVAWARFGPYAW